MERVKVRCPNPACGKTLMVKPSYARAHADCPVCGRAVVPQFELLLTFLYQTSDACAKAILKSPTTLQGLDEAEPRRFRDIYNPTAVRFEVEAFFVTAFLLLMGVRGQETAVAREIARRCAEKVVDRFGEAYARAHVARVFIARGEEYRSAAQDGSIERWGSILEEHIRFSGTLGRVEEKHTFALISDIFVGSMLSMTVASVVKNMAAPFWRRAMRVFDHSDDVRTLSVGKLIEQFLSDDAGNSE